MVSKLLIQVQQGSRQFQTSDWLGCSGEERKRFITHLTSSDECDRVVCSIGENLVQIFNREVEPSSIMQRDNTLDTFYRNLEIVKLGNQYCADIAMKLAHQNPNMRILEIGAGTGFATIAMLRALGLKFAHYDFTNISTGFFECAKEEQRDRGERINYHKLNVEEDPVAQGFQPESYDLVIAINVLHETVSMENTMRNVRRLLRNGGKAPVSEITTQSLELTMTFETLPGKLQRAVGVV